MVYDSFRGCKEFSFVFWTYIKFIFVLSKFSFIFVYQGIRTSPLPERFGSLFQPSVFHCLNCYIFIFIYTYVFQMLLLTTLYGSYLNCFWHRTDILFLLCWNDFLYFLLFISLETAPILPTKGRRNDYKKFPVPSLEFISTHSIGKADSLHVIKLPCVMTTCEKMDRPPGETGKEGVRDSNLLLNDSQLTQDKPSPTPVTQLVWSTGYEGSDGAGQAGQTGQPGQQGRRGSDGTPFGPERSGRKCDPWRLVDVQGNGTPTGLRVRIGSEPRG